MKRNIIAVRGTFQGIYGWGTGYLSKEKYNKWKEFWKTFNENNEGVFWNHVAVDEQEEYLVGTQGSIYLHPMDFTSILESGNTVKIHNANEHTVKTHLLFAVDELNTICKECAEYCGGSFALENTEEKEMEIGELKKYK